MDKFKTFLTNKKYRPFLIIGVIIIGAVILFSLIKPASGTSKSSQAIGTTGLSEQGQLAMSQIQAGLAAQQLEAQASYNVAAMGVGLEQANINAQASIAQTQASTALEIAKLETAFRTAEVESENDTQTQLVLAQIEADKFKAAQEAEIAFGQQQVDVTGIFAQRDVAMGEQRTAEKLIELTHEERMYGLDKAKKKHVGAILAGESPELGTKTKAITGLIGGLFSDLRVKSDVKFSGIRDGYNMFEYFNQKTGAIEAGVMAQDVPEHYQIPMGEFMGVDYIGLSAEMGAENG